MPWRQVMSDLYDKGTPNWSKLNTVLILLMQLYIAIGSVRGKSPDNVQATRETTCSPTNVR